MSVAVAARGEGAEECSQHQDAQERLEGVLWGQGSGRTNCGGPSGVKIEGWTIVVAGLVQKLLGWKWIEAWWGFYHLFLESFLRILIWIVPGCKWTLWELWSWSQVRNTVCRCSRDWWCCPRSWGAGTSCGRRWPRTPPGMPSLPSPWPRRPTSWAPRRTPQLWMGPWCLQSVGRSWTCTYNQ